MNANVKTFLKKKGVKVNEKAQRIIETAGMWYANEEMGDFHNRTTVNGIEYTMERTGFAKRACEDDANLCEVVNIITEDESANKYISSVLEASNFQAQLRKQIELMSATGTVGAYVRMVDAELMSDGSLKGGDIEIVYASPDCIHPISIKNDIVTECAFVSSFIKAGKTGYTVVVFKIDDDGLYTCDTYTLDEHGQEIVTRTIRVTLGEVKPFAILTTEKVNNIKNVSGYGLSKVYENIPVFKAVDLIFNVLMGDLDKSDKMILYNQALCDIDVKMGDIKTPNKTHKRVFVPLGSKLPDEKDVIKEINPTIRIDDITKTFELVLSLVSISFGFGSRRYSFENGQIKTATEYIGTKQDSMQELNRQRLNLSRYINDIIKAVVWFANAFNDENLTIEDGIKIDFDDSFIIDRQTELEGMRTDAQVFGLPGLVKHYLKEKYSLTDEELEAWYNDREDELNDIDEV